MTKLAIIGGGSAYTPDILESLLAEPHLFQGWEWVLHDVDRAAVATIARLGQGLARAAGCEVRVRPTLDLAEALAGARFVLAQPRPGGLRHRALDERIPLRHGVIGQETVGPGGLSFAWRSIPVMVEVARQMARLAPGAWLISYTNPAGMVCEALLRVQPGVRFLCLCDMPSGLQHEIARVLRADPGRVALEYRGLNHAGWSARVLLDGEDVTPRLLRLARRLPVEWLWPGEVAGTVRLFKEHGHLPDPYLRYYYYTDAILRRLRRARRTRAEVLLERLPRLYAHFRAQAAAPRPRLRLHRGHATHGDLAAGIIRAIAAGRRERYVIQQQNAGHVGGLVPGHAAQFPAEVGPDGWRPLPVPALDGPEGELIRRIQAAELRNVDAALTGDRQAAVEAMALNPLVPSRAVAERLVEELLAAHREYLPQFGG
ncbi:family 4 glycosyl hydrolase [Caldinitratiruptor microaerophilus]|uniref:6-phospho-beta-glucosidase n=1 Tax=Caldinitratiruptor microaerophilus TaxID=671077 RepID=A0AA35CL07_9FIRM|nr:hypothetical protein [Caldinitratiruptor microaerophilus]BDG59261.1 6-phospho-beta-glucosidase [Caldinitratiruptor microaerophilus]